jgi:hypothetical protein
MGRLKKKSGKLICLVCFGQVELVAPLGAWNIFDDFSIAVNMLSLLDKVNGGFI